MTQQYTNAHNLPLALSVFLATDNYDHNPDPYHLSATTLIKPIRQTILSMRVAPADTVIDVAQLIPSVIGSAVHDAIERSWLTNYKQALASLNVPKRVIDKVLINPEPEDLFEGCYPIYLEKRSAKQIGKYTISGKFDFVENGRVEDFKTTSPYNALSGNNDENYRLQGSIYRWLNPEIITHDQMNINFIFVVDWSAAQARSDPNYPQRRMTTKTLDLLSLAQTDTFVRNKVAELDRYWNAPEEELPYCTSEELWRSETVYRYYKNPEKTGRSTKNFSSKQDALIRMAQDGNVGVIREQPGQVRACHYCNAFTLCTQKDQLIASGELIV